MLFHLAGRPQNVSASSLIECKEMLGLSLEFGAHNLVWGKEVKEGQKIVWERSCRGQGQLYSAVFTTSALGLFVPHTPIREQPSSGPALLAHECLQCAGKSHRDSQLLIPMLPSGAQVGSGSTRETRDPCCLLGCDLVVCVL